MSAIVEHSHYDFGRHPLFGGMARPPHHHYHEGYAPQHGHYSQEQHPYQSQPPPQIPQQPRLPPMATMISAAGPSHQPPMLNGRDPPYPAGKPGYYSEYATPSPVGQTPPQFPGPNHDPHGLPRRTMDIRRSPTLSSTASDRSSDEVAQEMRLRQMSSFRDHHGQNQIPRPYGHHSPRLRGDSFQQHEQHTLPPGSAGNPSSSAPSYSVAPGIPNNIRPAPPHHHLPQSPPSSTQASSASPKQETRSMSISNILSSDNTSNQPLPPPMASPQVASSIHRITVRQQPYAARSCGFGERDRRVIDPPPIVQLTIHDDSLSKSEVSQLLRHQFSVVHCSIWDDKGEKDMSSMPEDFRQQRRLMGTLVASPFVGLDENGEEGCFFCFPDLSCRTPGSFRLKFALVVLDPINMRTGTKSDILATVFSEPFQVYNAKDFPGMKASTQLTKRLKEQGCLISIKKGNEKRDTPGSSRGGTGKDDDDYDEDDSDEGSAKWPRKKARRSA